MRNFTIWLTCLLFFVSMGMANAQSKVITGNVTSADDGLPIPGVTIMVPGTTVGTTSDFDGNYELRVDDGVTTLRFSFIGMQSQDIQIGNQTTINVVLELSMTSLDEVIVVAYGTATKKSFTGSATQISGAKLQRKNTTEITKALAGEIAGVQVINTSGQPGTNATIRIRGYGSVNASRAPLYVVDGVPFNGDLSGLDPSDVESYTVLKDASATAIYGSRGANGVILVTTRKGQKGDDRIDIEVKRGVNMKLIPEYNVISSPELYTELTWEGLKNKYTAQGAANPAQDASDDLFGTSGIASYYNLWNVDGDQVIDPATGKMNPNANRRYTPNNWGDEIFHTGAKTEATVKMSGGNEKSSYFTSLSYLGDEGYYINSNYDRFSARVNVEHKIKDWLKGSLNLSYSYSELNDPGQGTNANNGFAFVNNMPPIFPVYVRDAAGNIIEDPLIGGNMYDYGFDRGTGTRAYGGNINPAGAVQLDQREAIRNQTTINANIEAKLTKHLKFNATFGSQFYDDKQSQLTNFYYGDAAGIGRIYKDADARFSYTSNQILSYTNSFNDHNFSAFIAHENSFYKRTFMFGRKSNIAHPEIIEFNNAVILDDLSSYIVDWALESYFGQINYDYNEKYFFHATIRRDGTSRFPNNKWGTFGSVGGAWMVSKENFFSGISFINDLKLKVSYGVLGNQDIGNYPTFDQYTIANLDDEISIAFFYKGNPNLTWEKSKTFNIGAEMNISNILDLELEYYVKNTDQLLFNKQVSPSLGYSQYPVNDGKLKNSGIELSGLLRVINTADLKIDFTFNASSYSSELTRMPVDETTGLEKNIEVHGAYGWAKGHSIFDFYVREYAGVDVQTGESMWYKYYSEVGGVKEYFTDMEMFKAENPTLTEFGKETTTVYSDATTKFVGKSAIPKIMGGFGLNFKYKAFELSTQFIYSIGGYGYDFIYAQQMDNIDPGANNWNSDILNRWQNPGDVTDIPRLTAGYDTDISRQSTRFITSSAFLNLNNIRLSYTLPSNLVDKLNLSNMSIWVAGDNLFVLSNRQGYTPVTAEDNNTNRSRYVPLSSLTVGIKIQL